EVDQGTADGLAHPGRGFQGLRSEHGNPWQEEEAACREREDGRPAASKDEDDRGRRDEEHGEIVSPEGERHEESREDEPRTGRPRAKQQKKEREIGGREQAVCASLGGVDEQKRREREQSHEVEAVRSPLE